MTTILAVRAYLATHVGIFILLCGATAAGVVVVLRSASDIVIVALITAIPIILKQHKDAKESARKMDDIAKLVDGHQTALTAKVEESRVAAEKSQLDADRVRRIMVEVLDERERLAEELLRVQEPGVSTPAAIEQPPVAIAEGVVIVKGNERGKL